MTLEKDNITVLHFARWYPNRYDPMYGLFIQRHAEAVALYGTVGVIYVHATPDPLIPKRMEVCYHRENGVHTVRVYYPVSRCKQKQIGQLTGMIRFYKACNLGRKKIAREMGKPDVVHIHILTRMGIWGLYYKWMHQTPYVISEHWSRYLERTGSYQGRLRKFFTRMVVMNASYVTTVTQNLAEAMQRHGLTGVPYQVLPNVVDPVFFNPPLIQSKTPNLKTFIHVSCFEDKSKNISGLLRAVKLLFEKRNDFKVVLVGNGMDFDRMKNYAVELNLNGKQVEFTGLLQGEKLVAQMSQADMLLVTSHYENLPVVILESFVLGIPVLATRVGGIAEIVDPSNGLLISPGDENELVARMDDFLNGVLRFDSELIKANSRLNYTPKAVGQQLIDLYSRILRKNDVD